MHEITLNGCTPEPLMNYLKSLGVFRLVAEQSDLNATLSWRGGAAHLRSSLDARGLTDFFCETYRPTPILAPWNGGSGFYGGGSDPLTAIETSVTERLALYRTAISQIRTFLPDAKPKDEHKESLLVHCRAELGDTVVPWLDACFVLGESGPSYFPLLGTGGNDGRLDFTNNFMQRLGDVIAFDGKQSPAMDEGRGLLQSALFADSLTSVGKSAIGQFNPGGIGGPNGIQGKFEAESRVNPWDFVLMIEGCLLFAGSIARRMGTQSGSRTVFPFSVESVAVGYGSATSGEETTDGSRAELWLPLWDGNCTLAEIRHLFAEGRAQIGRRQARNAVEFVLAVNLLGVNRGVNAFARYGFLKRNGLAFLAAPLGRVVVTARPQARLLDDPPLARWMDRLRRACSDKDKTPIRYQSALREIDRAIFAFGNRSESANNAKYLLNVLAALGQAEQTMARGIAFCKSKYLNPLQKLSPQWLDQANDDSPEFRLAASIAGIRGNADRQAGSLRTFLEQVEIKGNSVGWSAGSTSVVWSAQSLANNLAAVFRRRLLETSHTGDLATPLDSPRPARLRDVIAFLNEEIDDDKLQDLVWGMMAVDVQAEQVREASDETDIPFEFGVPRLLVTSNAFVPNDGFWRLSGSENNAQADPAVFQLLASGRADAIGQCVTDAARRLKSGGLLIKGYRNRRHAGAFVSVSSRIRPERLLAAMLFPLSRNDFEEIAKSVLYPPEREE